jgi:indole-3-glycerol phosphate synthase
VEQRAERSVAHRRDFLAALTSRQPAVIAEIKKASPSKGILAEEFNPAAIARCYELGGAAALSVLTDEKHFQGSLSDLESAHGAVHLPVLRKDFTIDPYHVYQAAAYGSDAILLIAAILTERQMRDFRELADRYRMAALVEVHDEEELKVAIASGARLIGVNNRNLHTFEVSLKTSLCLADEIPTGIVRVAESGIHSSADVERLRAAGYQAFLVGEHLMKSGDPAGALRALLS